MQHPTIMAFRKRIKSLGYADIKIFRVKKYDDNLYNVSAVEPLSGVRVSREYSLSEMAHSMHRYEFLKANHKPNRRSRCSDEIEGQLFID